MVQASVGSGTKQVVSPSDIPAPRAAYSPAIRAGDFLFPSGLLASDFKTGIAPEALPKPGRPLDEQPIKLQTRYIFNTLNKVLEAGGTNLENLVRIDQFNLGREYAAGYIEARNEFLLKDRPASTLVPVTALMVPGAVIEVDTIAIVERPGFKKEVANSDQINFNVGGGYSQAVMAGDWVFGAGTTASDHTGAGPYPGGLGTGLAPEARVNPNYWYGSEIKTQTLYVMRTKMKAMLEAGGSSLDDVVRAQVYLSDVTHDWAGFIEAWQELYPDPSKQPALTVYPVTTFGTIGARIEISVIALKSGSKLERRVIQTDRAPAPIGPCPQAVQAGPYLFFSTQLAADENGLAPEAAVHPAFPYNEQAGKKQITYILRNVESICQAAGSDLSCIVKRWAMHTDLRDFAPAMEVWKEAFPKDPPASTTLGVPAPLPVPDCSIALDLIGYLGG